MDWTAAPIRPCQWRGSLFMWMLLWTLVSRRAEISDWETLPPPNWFDRTRVQTKPATCTFKPFRMPIPDNTPIQYTGILSSLRFCTFLDTMWPFFFYITSLQSLKWLSCSGETLSDEQTPSSPCVVIQASQLPGNTPGCHHLPSSF